MLVAEAWGVVSFVMARFDELYLWAHDVLGFYTRLGFTVLERCTYLGGECVSLAESRSEFPVVALFVEAALVSVVVEEEWAGFACV